ncbi:zinc finger protein 260-like isoform X3 [Micropterus dolomieu]|uniref:zinc finger protein 260-like isoform X2 n=1 Tax=Micropterus dolomieu TaxID=147949 RepID=UPI001E8D6138|nr:zinc finger protein 260-like isoform X2 [Micropterus dolomieu]XP_045914812.1 zinc finger protein 260-like isoform X3 [Micropterus dolomieu]
MSKKVQTLRAFVNQRLCAAAEEIFGLFERTISEYEEEIDRQRSLLQDAQKDEAVFPANVKKSTVIKEVPPEQQQHWSPRLDQEDPPEPPHVKEEQEDLWTSQEGEQLPELEEADITKFPFTLVPMKSEEDDEEKPQSSQLHQTEENRDAEHLKTETDGEDSGGPEPARNLNPGGHLQPDNKTSLSSETEDRSDVLKQRKERQPGLHTLKNNEAGCDAAKQCFSCSECGKRFDSKDHLQIHMKCHTGEKTFTCPFCGKKFTKSSNLTTHLRVHTGEKPFTCSVCNTSFSLRCTLVNHMRVHTGEKPFSCSVCSKRFSKKANLTTHMALHTEEKPFKCSMCDKRFTWHSQVKNHKCVVDSSR